MNKEIVGKVFPDLLKLVEEGICPFCLKKVNFEDFSDELSRKEFEISGLCDECQKETFK